MLTNVIDRPLSQAKDCQFRFVLLSHANDMVLELGIVLRVIYEDNAAAKVIENDDSFG